MRLLSTFPDLSKQRNYRYRNVKSYTDLQSFVDLSDNEIDIMGANPELDKERRMELYKNWAQWSCTKPALEWNHPDNYVKSFLLLEKLNPTAEWEPAGLSILPLTAAGGTLLMGTDPEVLNTKINATSLLESEIARESSCCILIDTWIVSKKAKKGKQIIREEHNGWGIGLIIRHLAKFWDLNQFNRITVFAEPDNPRIGWMLQQIGFEKHERNEKSGDIYFCEFPLNEYRYSKKIIDDLDRTIINNIKRSLEIELVNN